MKNVISRSVGAVALLLAGATAVWACDKPRQMDGFKTCANVDKAFEEGALVHYAPDTETAQAQYLADFRAMFPQISTNFLRLQTGALYARLNAERQGRTYVPDTLILTEIGFALDFQKRGGWAHYLSPELVHYQPHEKSTPEGYYTWDNEIIAGIAYNPNVVKPEEAPKSWKDLLDPRWAGVINVKLSTSGLQHSVWWAMLQLYGPEYWAKFSELKPRGFDSYVQQYDRTVSGQDHVISTAQYSGYLIAKAKGAPIEFVVPTEGLGVAPGVLGVVDKAPHPEVARLFVDWYLGIPGQTAMTKATKNYSPRSDVPPPPGGVSMTGAKMLVPADWPAFLKSHAQYVREWDKMTGLR
ncbi:MAG: ABC transporter substrate-binding protein [Acetobacteraceae bacterium]